MTHEIDVQQVLTETFTQTTKRLMREQDLSFSDAQNKAIKLRAAAVSSIAGRRAEPTRSTITIDPSESVQATTKRLMREKHLGYADAQNLAVKLRASTPTNAAPTGEPTTTTAPTTTTTTAPGTVPLRDVDGTSGFDDVYEQRVLAAAAEEARWHNQAYRARDERVDAVYQRLRRGGVEETRARKIAEIAVDAVARSKAAAT